MGINMITLCNRMLFWPILTHILLQFSRCIYIIYSGTFLIQTPLIHLGQKKVPELMRCPLVELNATYSLFEDPD